MDLQITAFPARNGESLLIECYGKEKTNILVDMGFSETYNKFIKPKLKSIGEKGEKIDLLVLTHYDSDHVEGAVEFFKDIINEEFIDIQEIWINDFYALSSDVLDIKDLDEENENIYKFARFMSKIYGRDNSKINKVEVSKDDVMNITKLIEELGYNFKINKSFEYRLVFNDEDKYSVVNINDEVNIKIIGPTKANVEKLSKEFFYWIKKNYRNYLDIKKEELFEIFVANISKEEDKNTNNLIRKVEVNSSDDDDVIKEILSQNNKYRDTSLANRNSIAFTLEFNGYKLILAGDTDHKTLIKNIPQNENYSLLKVPHHGSRNNINRELLKKINCKNYLICTDGSGRSRHPDLETLLYISEIENSNIYINYPINKLAIPTKRLKKLKDNNIINLYENTLKNQPFIIKFKEGEIVCTKNNH